MSPFGWLRRARRDRDREEELRAHLAMHIEDLMGRGLDEVEARRQARILLGNARSRREEIDDMQRLPFFDTLARDVRYALRVLRRSPGFTFTAVATLALAIGANSAVFSLADALLFKPLSFPEPDRLALAQPEYVSPRGQRNGLSVDGAYWKALAATEWGAQSAVFTNWTTGVNLVVNGRAMFADQQRVGAGFFRTLGASPAIGREFTPDEDVPGGPALTILSYRLWQQAFDGDPTMLGQTILLRGEPWEVIGIMPEGFRGTTEADLWTPLRPNTDGEGAGTNYAVLIRVPGDVPFDAAAQQMTPLVLSGLREQGLAADVSVTAGLEPLHDALSDGDRQPIVLLGAAVGIVLIIACVNLATLLLARGGARSHEIATRLALGSGRRTVIRQLMTESLVLAAAGGVAGVFMGRLVLRGLQAIGGDRFSDWSRASIDGSVLLVSAGLSLVTAVVFGLVPAWQSSRLDVSKALVEGASRSVAGGVRHWTRRGMILAQVSLGVVLLVTAGLLLRTFVNLQSLNPGFNPDGLTTASVSLLDARYTTAEAVNVLFDRSLERLRETPGVEAASVSLGLPYQRVLNMGFRYPEEENGHTASVLYVTRDFFRTFQIPLRRGREFQSTDVPQSRQVVVVNEAFERIYSKDRPALGRVIRLSNAEREIVGVVGDVQMQPGFSVEGAIPGPVVASPAVYLPAAQINDRIIGTHIWFAPVWTVRAASPAVAAQAIEAALGGVDPLLPVGTVQRMSDVRASAIAEHTMLMTLVGTLAMIALLLAAIGLHGLISHAVTERTREFGIRMALGATPGDTVRDVALGGVKLAAVGACLGAALALPATSLVASLLYDVAERDLLTYAGAALFLLVVASGASLLPALRLLRLDPAKTLRQ
jgi:predicted permease